MDNLKLAIEKSSISVVTFVEGRKKMKVKTLHMNVTEKNRHTKHSEGHLSLCKTIN